MSHECDLNSGSGFQRGGWRGMILVVEIKKTEKIEI